MNINFYSTCECVAGEVKEREGSDGKMRDVRMGVGEEMKERQRGGWSVMEK